MKTPPHKKALAGSSRDFFLYLLLTISLAMSIWSVIGLLFTYIDILLPDGGSLYGAFSYQIRSSLSSLIVFFPVYIGFSWYLRKETIKEPEKLNFWVRKLLLHFVLFATALTLIIDLITLLNNFLEGGLTLHFFLKVAVVFAVSGAVFAYYFWDLKRKVTTKSKPALGIAALASLVIAAIVVGGFFFIDSPMKERQLHMDAQRVNDLQMIQGEITNYWLRTGKIPAALADAATEKNYAGGAVEYTPLAALSFELCTTFDLSSADSSNAPYAFKYMPSAPQVSPRDLTPTYESWDHGAGRVCFTRRINPENYGK